MLTNGEEDVKSNAYRARVANSPRLARSLPKVNNIGLRAEEFEATH